MLSINRRALVRTRWARSRWHCAMFFFFQAEDGIRDLTVTGVQTCALPILSAAGFAVGYAGSLVAFAAAYPFAAARAYWGCFVAAAVLFAVFAIPSFVILPAEDRKSVV